MLGDNDLAMAARANGPEFYVPVDTMACVPLGNATEQDACLRLPILWIVLTSASIYKRKLQAGSTYGLKRTNC